MAVLPIALTTYGLTQLAAGTFAPDRLVLGDGVPGTPHDQFTTALTSVVKTVIAPGDLLQLSAQEVGDDVRLHVVSLDDSGDAYTLREFALADATGFLAVYGDGTNVATKGVAALHFEFDMTLANAAPGDVVIGPTAYLLPTATEAQTGVVQLATAAEVAAGAATDRAVSPARASEHFAKLAGGNTLTGTQALTGGDFTTDYEFSYATPKTRTLQLDPMSAWSLTPGAWTYVHGLSSGFPTNTSYWECSVDGGLLVYPLTRFLRVGVTVSQVRVNWQNTGASGRSGTSRLACRIISRSQSMGVVGSSGAGGGTLGTPSEVDDGGAGSGILTLDYTSLPSLSPIGTRFLAIRAGTPSNGGSKDRIWGVELTLDDPGPRSF